ncbi:MAG: sensor histidine kinase, partial [Boseongicola sp. SB0673_bin_14]|nr:sensor histidine kinase [Boseongicola sp. SB0673_bin_14]
MTETPIHPYGPRTNWVRLQTLVVLRWIAILGQFSAIVVAQRLFGLDLLFGLCLLTICASVAANLLAIAVYPRAKRLSEAEVAGMLAFDVLQLALLVFLTGGLNNPFALLIIAPVAIAAMTLNAPAAAGIALLAVASATCLLFWHIPLRTLEGVAMQMPQEFAFGFLVAIVIGILFLSVYASRVTGEMQTLSEALAATQLALSRD